jgi:malate dehydrogenase (oxaloacetate-decarboxylating)(NADP+)
MLSSSLAARSPLLSLAITRSPRFLSSQQHYSTASTSSLDSTAINAYTWKDTAFDTEKRDELGLRGLLPPALQNMDLQVERTLHQMRGKKTALGKNIFLTALRQTNVRLFYAMVMRNAEECLPLIYTPVVGEACQKVRNALLRGYTLYLMLPLRSFLASIVDQKD